MKWKFKLQPWNRITAGIHHLHIRQRIHKEFAEYPHKEKWIRFIDNLAFASGIFGQLMTLPQLYLVWIENQVAGVSVLSWSAYTINAIIWCTYGIVHKAKPIIIVYSIWIIMNGLIVAGVLLNAQ